MASVYPGSLDSLATNKANATSQNTDHPAHHNDLADAVNKIEAELGTNPSAAFSTVATRLTDIEAGLPVFNVKKAAYGALGDNSNDDSAEIQLAIDAAGAAGGGIVYFPAGTYICNGLLIDDNNIILQGESSGTSILKQVSSAADGTRIVRAEGTGTGTSTNVFGITLRDIQFLGRSDTDTETQFVHLVAFSGVSDLTIERCYFNKYRGDAVYLGSGLDSAIERHNERVRIRDCKFTGGGTDNNRNCISIIDGTDVWIEDNWFFDAVKSTRPGAIDLEPNAAVYPRLRNIHIRNNIFDDILGNAGVIGLLHSDQQADLTTKTQGIFIVGNTFRNNGNTAAAINLNFNQTPTSTTAPNNVLIHGNHIIQSTQQPVVLEGCRGFEIVDNYIAYGYDGSAMSLGFVFTDMDGRVERNHIHRTGTSNTEVGIYLFNMDRLRVQDNRFDNIKTLMPFEHNGSSSHSTGIDFTDNRIVGSVTTAVSTKHASHTLTNGAADNRANRNKVGNVNIDGAIFAGGDRTTIPSIASAATLTAPAEADVISVTGSTTVTSITASWPGRMLTVLWAAAATFDMTDGSNLKLASSITAHDADDTVTLRSDGTNWYEIGRAVN